ncbi:mRNA triphosphatase CET1 [Xylariaceae sp. FL0016]|nr:mRNA triphosphatase CET1 [Xylariaceae sp. FL0016]
MDLRAMLNTEGGGGGDRNSASSSSKRPPPPPPKVSTSSNHIPAAPATPVQSVPPSHAFRDYSHPPHASPVPQTHEYPPGPQSAHPGHGAASAGIGPYASPTSYHNPANAFQGRPQVPPLHPLPTHDPRSPGSASISGPSPYRHTPTSSVSASSGGYFPPPQQPPASPVQRHQYGPQTAYPRDSYSQQTPAATPANLPPSHGSVSYMQGQQQPQPHQQQMPQTPPVGTPGGSSAYLHQRSLSVHSTPTPTSAHSQHPPYPPPYAQGSPVATTHQPPSHIDQAHIHQSPQQVATPLGPPMPAPPRHPSSAHYPHPSSPYQARTSSLASAYPPTIQNSPPPPPPSSVSRASVGSQGSYDAVAASHRRSQSQQSRGERERSLSVSPKTRVPSLPSSTGQGASSTGGEPDPQQIQPHSQAAAHPVTVNPAINMEPQRDATPAKRKIDDRDLPPEELENHRQPPPAPTMNGNHAGLPQTRPKPSVSPVLARRKRAMHATPPLFAQCGRRRAPASSRNFSLKQHTAASGSSKLVNGNSHDTAGSVKSERMSRHPSPEATRGTPNVKSEEPNHTGLKESQTFQGRPFPWEPSIENTKPIDHISRQVADFFVFNVLNGPNLEEVQARGVQFEIEAKMGTIIDKATNERMDLRVRSGEIIVGEESRVAFRSSMTEIQHRRLNEYLNENTKASQIPAASRVPINYVHRREVDKFYELPPPLAQRLPACVSGLLQRNVPVKARISYEQQTGAIIAKIVKARVADIHIHMPHMPLDCRISINLEWEWEGPVEEIERLQIPNKERPPDRNKDRLSYKHGFYQVDLTQVTHPQSQGPMTKEHELEVELDSQVLLEHGQFLMSGQPNRYTDLVDGLVDRVRVLARACPEPRM